MPSSKRELNVFVTESLKCDGKNHFSSHEIVNLRFKNFVRSIGGSEEIYSFLQETFKNYQEEYEQCGCVNTEATAYHAIKIIQQTYLEVAEFEGKRAAALVQVIDSGSSFLTDEHRNKVATVTEFMKLF